MRVPLAVALALSVLASGVLAGCTYEDGGEDLGRLQIVLLIPHNTAAWKLDHVFVNVVNISLQTTEDRPSEFLDVKPTRSRVDISNDVAIFDGRVPPGVYDNFDIWVKDDMEGVFENGTRVPMHTAPWYHPELGLGKHRVHQERGREVVVIGGESLRFEIISEIAKQGDDFVWL